ncbi:PP2C family protein-serine/threonine phosphatase [Streptomyces sp. NPDC048256]|uniref:PP2C family protein-serine/threonine phosphatase n=1 Tax=unclassified Streptomyces TaxID=2593676 RepID=UPI0033E6EC1F
MTAEVNDEQLMGFLADSANRTLELSMAVARCTEALGLQHAVAYLADPQQRRLVPLTDLASTLSIDDSLAGWTYRTQSLRVEESGTGGVTAWCPLLDGAERLGVLAVHTPVLTAASLTRGSALGTLLSMMITSKLIREQQLVADALEGEPDPPMGLPFLSAGRSRQIHEYALQPGDRVLLYTDGVTEARTRDGHLFGLERFADHVIRATAAGELAPESLRRLIHAILDTKTSRFQDDATILLLEWNPPAPES